MVGEHTIFDEPHHQSLELLAAQALAEGNAQEAFRLADRRCRILPFPEPHSYVLRSEAAYQIGARTAAIADLAKALEIAPHDLPANRRMLMWGTGEQQTQAAIAIIERERDVEMLREAVRSLQATGQQNFASVTVLEDSIDGWALWQKDVALEITISDGVDVSREMIEANAFHPLGEYGQAASFSLRRPKSARAQTISLLVSGEEFHSTRTAGREKAFNVRVLRPRASAAQERQATVIVPIYGDYDATRLCLESLLRELKSGRHRAILVNDATPNARIAKYLAKLTGRQRVEVLVNERNLGFIGSVNRALNHTRHGDVILLNSDTLVPSGFIDRLAAAAHSSPDIGTVTPLSNNGEFVSFPVPNTSNSLRSADDIERIDAIATQVNAGVVVDIPSGIGFCLYVTRACLDRVGPLSEDFGAGYLEDADFCLRARALGFRNVCAPSVYVGHAGSKSFQQEKRGLVVRNLGILERRFPKHRMECGAFMAADPLRPAREAIERATVTASRPILLVTGAGTMRAIARERAFRLAAEGSSVIIVEVHHGVDGVRIELQHVGGEIPQSLQFHLGSKNDCIKLADLTKDMQPSRIEIVDPAHTPPQLVDMWLGLKIPYDMLISDAGLIEPQARPRAAASQALAPAAQLKHGHLKIAGEAGGTGIADRWSDFIDGAQRLIAPSEHALAFAKAILPGRTVEAIAASGRQTSTRRKRATKKARLGFVPVRLCAQEQMLMGDLARRLYTQRPDMALTVIGGALDDIDLMRASHAFVTGAVAADEFDDLVTTLGLGFLFVTATEPLFGHPILTAVDACSLPVASFDWSMGQFQPRAGDLAIDPSASLDDIIHALNEWVPAP